MAKKNDCWGIEVGSHALKAVRLVRAGSDVELVDYELLPFKQVLTTPDLNVDEAIEGALEAFLAKHDVSRSSLVVSVPGHMAFARFAKLPPVEPKKLGQIVRYEAQQQIPFPIDQVEWDYQVFQEADSPDVEVGIFAITKERVMNVLNNYRSVNMEVDAITLSPVAVYNAFHYEAAGNPGGEGGTIYMDIGTKSTDVIIVDGGGIWLRTLPIGGNNFTEALVRSFKLSFSKAERLKREAGTSKYARQIFQAMRPVFADLVQELQRSIGYYQSINREATLKRLVGVGSTFRLPGLQKFLKQQLQIEVTRPESFQRLQIDGKREAEFAQHTINMATAYGLALQGLDEERVSANVLPNFLLQQRLWSAKQPWIAAAAACVAIGSAIFTGNYLYESRTYEPIAEATTSHVEPIVSQARQFQSEWDSVSSEEDPRQMIENLRRIGDYRQFIPLLIHDISEASLAVDPQEALLGDDFEAIRQIPRNQRRMLYIDNFSMAYQPEREDEEPEQRGFTMRGFQDSVDQLDYGLRVEDFFDADRNTAPRFRIVIEGRTPHSSGPRMIQEQFVGYLQENADRWDRPYRIEIDPREVLSSEQIDPRRQDRDDRRRERRYDPMMEDEMMMGGRTRTTRGRRGSIDEELYPRHPLADEETGDDWRFTLEFEIAMRPPDAARRLEPDAAPEPAEPDDEPWAEAAPQRDAVRDERASEAAARREDDEESPS